LEFTTSAMALRADHSKDGDPDEVGNSGQSPVT